MMANLSPPEPDIISPLNGSVVGTGDVLVTALELTEDPYLDNVRFEYFDPLLGDWKCIGDASIYEDDSSTRNEEFRVIWDTSNLPEDDYTLRVIMTNPDHSVTTTVSVTLETSPIPHISADFDLSPGDVYLSGAGSTDDDSISIYEWDIDNDGMTDYTGHAVLFTLPDPSDIYLINLAVTDTSGIFAQTKAGIKPDEKKIISYSLKALQGKLKIWEEVHSVSQDKTELRKKYSYGSDEYSRLSEAINLMLDARVLMNNMAYELFKDPTDYSKMEDYLKQAQDKIKQAIEKLKEAETAGADSTVIKDNIEALHKAFIKISWLRGLVKWAEWLGPDNKYVKKFPLPGVGSRNRSSYSPGSTDINIDKKNDYDVDVHLHELDHKVQNEKYGGAAITGAGGTHYLTQLYNDGLALSEGWAQFSACAKVGSNVFRTEGQKFEQDLETNEAWRLDANGNRKLPKITLPQDSSNEAAVAATFWDLFDGNDDGETVQIGMDKIFAALNQEVGTGSNKYPETMEEYYEALIAVTGGTPSAADIKAVFNKNGMNIS
jgi:hypothetical protein